MNYLKEDLYKNVRANYIALAQFQGYDSESEVQWSVVLLQKTENHFAEILEAWLFCSAAVEDSATVGTQ